MTESIKIDGRMGEGGGQILRSALTLSMLFQIPFEIDHIRGKRSKPGLMRQHLTCVMAAKEICQAQVQGDELGSSRLVFSPGQVSPGQYDFKIGTAGSTTLVFQTILLPLLFANEQSEVTFCGGTHNPLAPSLSFLKDSFLPLLVEMGGKVEIEEETWGFMPAGGGLWKALIVPSRLQPIYKTKRSKIKQASVTAYLSGVPRHVGERELTAFAPTDLEVSDRTIMQCESCCAGNLLQAKLEFEDSTIALDTLGRTRLSAERVAMYLNETVDSYMSSDAVLDEHLTDQMMLPMVMAEGGAFSCETFSLHASTNRDIIKLFTGKDICMENSLMQLS